MKKVAIVTFVCVFALTTGFAITEVYAKKKGNEGKTYDQNYYINCDNGVLAGIVSGKKPTQSQINKVKQANCKKKENNFIPAVHAQQQTIYTIKCEDGSTIEARVKADGTKPQKKDVCKGLPLTGSSQTDPYTVRK